MHPSVAELIAALPEGLDREAEPTHDLTARLADLARRPMPVGRLTRFWVLGSLQAKLAAAYLAWWLRKGFRSQESSARALDETHLKAALELVGTMGYLRGAVMKLGQTLASWPDVVPLQFSEALSVLHFEAPPMHFALLRELLRAELGDDPEALFAEFEPEAFAAASLGQVHRARLHTGERVAVKIQYPSIARSIHADLANLSALLAPMRVSGDWDNLRAQFDDIRAMLDLELDYRHEAVMQESARALLADDERLVVPRVHAAVSSERVLTTDLLEGLHLRAFLATAPDQALRDRHGQQLSDADFRLMYEGRMVYADPHPGNALFLPDGRLGLLDFGCVRALDDAEWDYCDLAGRAMREGRGEAYDQLTVEGTANRQLSDLDPHQRRLVNAHCDWLWEPIRHHGPFDFGDPDYFRRGAAITAELMRRRQTRSRPVNTWLNRSFFGVRAMLHHLGARVDMRSAEERWRPLGAVGD